MSLEEKLFAKSYTHLVMLLDRSGSMNSILEPTISGFNKMIEDQKKIEGKATISMYQFDDQFDVLYEMKDIKDSVELNTSNFMPRGQTRLLDGIGRTIVTTKEAIEKLPENERPTRVVFTIITDGGENDSQEYTQEAVNDMINSAEKSNGWAFVYLGANQDAVATAKGLGIKASSAMTYGANTRGVSNATFSMNKMYSRIRTASVEDEEDIVLDSLASFDDEDYSLQDGD